MHFMLCRRFVWPAVEYVVLMFFVRRINLFTDADAICGRPKLKHIVERFLNGSVGYLKKKIFRVKDYQSERNYSQTLIPVS
jgi:hypothetical protein